MDASLPQAHGPDVGDDPVAARAAAADHLAAAAAGLGSGFREVFPAVVEAQVARVVTAWGRLTPDELIAVGKAARAAGEQASRVLADEWESQASLSPEHHRRGPLEFLRELAPYPTAVLAGAGIPPVRRDDFSLGRFPDDVYGLIVERFIDLPHARAPELHAIHLTWGVAKALWFKAEQAVRARS